MYYQMRPIYPNELMHSGIKGQKWGVRRYQNPDGTLTKAGKLRYYKKVLAEGEKASFIASEQKKRSDAYDKNAETRYQKILKNGMSNKRSNNKYNKAQARYRDEKERFEFWNKRASAKLAEAKKLANDIVKNHSDAKIRKVPDSVHEAAYNFFTAHTHTYYNYVTDSFDTYTPTLMEMRGYMRKVEKSQNFDKKAFQKLYKELKKMDLDRSVYYDKRK